jgi:hypothetical protein
MFVRSEHLMVYKTRAVAISYIYLDFRLSENKCMTKLLYNLLQHLQLEVNLKMLSMAQVTWRGMME